MKHSCRTGDNIRVVPENVDEIDYKPVGKVPVPLLKNFVAQDEINSLALTSNLLGQQALKILIR